MTAVNTEAPTSINITADTTKGIISGTADINASPERIFRALTTEEQAEWWGQGDYKTHDYVIDLRPGGRWSCKATSPKGRHINRWWRVHHDRSPEGSRVHVGAELGQLRSEPCSHRARAARVRNTIDSASHWLRGSRGYGREPQEWLDESDGLVVGLRRSQIASRFSHYDQLDVL
jgi:hypothetical protein